MAINIQIYSNVNSASKTVTFDFVGEILAANNEIFGPSPANTASTEYFFKVTTGARQVGNAAYPVKLVRSLSELVLNGQKQRIETSYSNAYPSVKSMIIDYVYDYINGHEANLGGSVCTAQAPMKFT